MTFATGTAGKSPTDVALLQYLSLTRADMPCLLLLDTGAGNVEGMGHGHLVKYPLKLDPEALPEVQSIHMSAHVAAFLAGKLKPKMLSEEEEDEEEYDDEKEDGKGEGERKQEQEDGRGGAKGGASNIDGIVRRAVGSSLPRLVAALPSGGVLFLALYKRKDQYCDRFRSAKFAELAGAAAAAGAGYGDAVVVAEMDGEANEIEGVRVRRFPTLLLFTAPASAPVEYRGKHSVDAMLAFIDAHVTVALAPNVAKDKDSGGGSSINTCVDGTGTAGECESNGIQHPLAEDKGASSNGNVDVVDTKMNEDVDQI